MAVFDLLLLLATALTGLYLWVKYNFGYWRRKNVAYIEPDHIFGNLKDMIITKSSAADHITSLYNHKDANDQPVVGIYVFNKPALLVRELNLVKSMLVKDFNKFSDRFSACDPHGDTLGSYNLFFLRNPHWKELRTKLTPVFTSGKIKQMFPLMEEIGKELDELLCNLPVDPETKSIVKEVKDISALYTTDIIASVAYGIQANSLKDPNNDFRRNGKPLFTFTLYRAMQFTVVFFLPQFVRLLRCKMFPPAATNFIRDTINQAMSDRVRSGSRRNDLIDILVAFKKAAELDKEKEIFAQNPDMIIAQAAIFFTAGFETTSTTMSFAMYELAKSPEVQKRLREEIKEALIKNDGRITYDMLQEMEYLNMVVQEVLRLYPPLPFLDRQCVLPKDETEYSLKPYSDFGVPNQMPVYIPIYSIQRDPAYFPDPETFDPERFSPENKSSLVPFSYMPFGTGPHNCIGERFGLVQTKIGLINFLRNHYLTTCDKTLKKMTLEPKALIIQAKGGIHLRLVRDPLFS